MARHGWLAGHAGKDPNAGLAHFKTHHIHHVLMAVINVMFPVPPTRLQAKEMGVISVFQQVLCTFSKCPSSPDNI